MICNYDHTYYNIFLCTIQTRYKWPKPHIDGDGNECQGELEEIDRCTYDTNQVTYMNGK